MARYKAIDTSPRLLAVDQEKQLLPGCFEHAMHHLLDHEFDLSPFDTRYLNDQSGACAWHSCFDDSLENLPTHAPKYDKAVPRILICHFLCERGLFANVI